VSIFVEDEWDCWGTLGDGEGLFYGRFLFICFFEGPLGGAKSQVLCFDN
jgi:hypothetical protein